MPIHFSVGFVVENRPGVSVVNLCGGVNLGVRVLATWPTGNDCGCGYSPCGCIRRGVLCIPRGDDVRVVVDVFDSDGDEFDLDGLTGAVFVVADGDRIAGDMYPGGSVKIEKQLGDGIQLAGTGYQLVVTMSSAETASLPRRNLYYEIQVTTSDGLKKTVSAGLFLAESTMIKDLV